MKVSELLNNISVLQVTGNAEEAEIENITLDSRQAGKKTLFFAIKGYKTDGHKFIPDAVNAGAPAVVLDNNDAVPEQLFDQSRCVKILVKDSRLALSKVSNVFYDGVSKKLKVYGITGTKGKSTTAFYLKSILEENKNKCGLIGTITNYIGQKEIKSRLTTPEANEINKMMKEMLDTGCTHCVMEVSSHSLFLSRVADIDFDAAIFTNIASDHLDFHKTFEHYRDSKKILFDQLKDDAVVICNTDDENSVYMLKDSKARKFSFGANENADFKLSNVDYDFKGTTFTITYKGEQYNLQTRLIGDFNAYNAGFAFATALIENVESETAIKGIKNTPQVPGRFELMEKGGKKIIIDYSHNASSLEQALKVLNYINKEKLPVHTVFGCGGDRDKTKRPVMGSIADKLSDVIYVTSDNPRTEDPGKIIDDIVKGIKRSDYHRIENREQAIKSAIENSEDNAVVFIAGKGHETYQEVNGVRSFFSDKETALKYLN